MANKHWLGIADAVAQVATGSIDSVDATPANNTFTVTIGGVAISAVGDTDVATTATNLRASLNGSTHPYFSGITWSGTGGDIIGTADVAGVPFVAALTETGAGTGAVTDFAATVGSEGPCDWSTPENWSDGAIPGTGDTVIFANNAVDVCFGLDNNALAINDLFIEQTYTGKIGLNRNALVASADGATVDASKQEYREDYLRIDVDLIEIGKHVGTGTALGSQRLKIDNTASGASETIVFSTANAGAENNLPPVRTKYNSTTADIFIRGGSVGIAVDEPNETAIIGDLYLNGVNSDVNCGDGCQIQTVVQTNGQSLIQSSTTITSIDLLNGIMTLEGDFTVTTINVEDGTLIPNHDKSAGVAITTLNINGGVVDGTRTSELRTWTTVNLNVGASLKVNSDLVTMTNFNDPSGEYTIQVS